MHFSVSLFIFIYSIIFHASLFILYDSFILTVLYKSFYYQNSNIIKWILATMIQWYKVTKNSNICKKITNSQMRNFESYYLWFCWYQLTYLPASIKIRRSFVGIAWFVAPSKHRNEWWYTISIISLSIILNENMTLKNLWF